MSCNLLGGGFVFLGINSFLKATSDIRVSVKLLYDIHPLKSRFDSLPNVRDAYRGYRLGVRTTGQ